MTTDYSACKVVSSPVPRLIYVSIIYAIMLRSESGNETRYKPCTPSNQSSCSSSLEKTLSCTIKKSHLANTMQTS